VPFTTVILDVCFAASYLGFLREARLGGLGSPPNLQLEWLRALATATPGTRLIFSTGADRLSGESPQHRNGYFTSAFLTALTRSRGDIQTEEGTWVSDQRAFAVTRRVLRDLTNGKQVPVERGLTGDFPLALSQADEPVGGANFIRTSVEAGTLNVRFEVDERKNVETRLRWSLTNDAGTEIAASVRSVIPDDWGGVYRGHFEFPHGRVQDDQATAIQCMTYGRARLEWVLTIEDVHGHVLDEKVVPLLYRP
ncbi:MAG TPA: hypothetical protein VLC09_03135, partial [Polyangiaceae bacterium]|nr:hypothetical protein [Polyangiaceae bacterium]